MLVTDNFLFITIFGYPYKIKHNQIDKVWDDLVIRVTY